MKSPGQSSYATTSTLDSPHPDTTTGPGQSETIEQNAHEQLSLSTGELNLFIPILSLPQRGGRSLTIGYVHSSNTWAAKETSVTYNQYGTANGSNPQTWWLETYATVQYLPTSQNNVWGDESLHLNIPTLSSDLVYAGGYDTAHGQPNGPAVPNYTAAYCVTDWTFTDWQGSSHSFRGYQNCMNHLDPQFIDPQGGQNEAADDSGYLLDSSNNADIKVIAQDGVVYHFTGYSSAGYAGMELNYYDRIFSSMVDPNGNTVSYSAPILTDTMGRQINITNGNLSWAYQGSPSASPTTVSVTRSDSNSGVVVPFPLDFVPSCQAKPYMPDGAAAAGYSGPALRASAMTR